MRTSLASREGTCYRFSMSDYERKKLSGPQIAVFIAVLLFFAVLLYGPLRDWITRAFPAQ